jgi:hypothetical protein
VAFSQNIPNLPIQILAVTESGGAANAFFNSELSHQLITAGNAAADRLQVCYKFRPDTHTHTHQINDLMNLRLVFKKKKWLLIFYLISIFPF